MRGIVLNDIVVEVTNIIADGVANIRPFMNRLLFILVSFDLVIFGYRIVLGNAQGQVGIGMLAWKVLTIGFVCYVVLNFADLSWKFQNYVFDVASSVSGEASVEVFTSPDDIFKFAKVEILDPLHENLKAVTGHDATERWSPYDGRRDPGYDGRGEPDSDYVPPSREGGFRFKDIPTYVIFGLLWVVIVFCFGAIAITLAVSLIEFYLLVVFSLIIIPFIAFQPTNFLGTKPFGAVIGGAIKIGMLVLVTGVVFKVFRSMIDVPGIEDLTLAWMMQVILLSAISVYIVVQIPGLAASLLSGQPSLSAGGAFSTLAALGGFALGKATRAAKLGLGVAKGAATVVGEGYMGGMAVAKAAQDVVGRGASVAMSGVGKAMSMAGKGIKAAAGATSEALGVGLSPTASLIRRARLQGMSSGSPGRSKSK